MVDWLQILVHLVAVLLNLYGVIFERMIHSSFHSIFNVDCSFILEGGWTLLIIQCLSIGSVYTSSLVFFVILLLTGSLRFGLSIYSFCCVIFVIVGNSVNSLRFSSLCSMDTAVWEAFRTNDSLCTRFYMVIALAFWKGFLSTDVVFKNRSLLPPFSRFFMILLLSANLLFGFLDHGSSIVIVALINNPF